VVLCSTEISIQSNNLNNFVRILYSPFCVQAKIIKLVGLKNGGRLSPINLVTFAGTQNGELNFGQGWSIFGFQFFSTFHAILI
jgi:hypothetical protein